MTQPKHQMVSASQQVADMTERMQAVFQTLQKNLKRYRSQKHAKGVARVYLERSDLPRMLADLRELPPRVEVSDEKQERRLSGTLMRAEMALQFVEAGDGDAFEKAQVLEDAVRDFGLRLRERGLLLEIVPHLPNSVYELLRRTNSVSPTGKGTEAQAVEYGNAA